MTCQANIKKSHPLMHIDQELNLIHNASRSLQEMLFMEGLISWDTSFVQPQEFMVKKRFN